MLQGQVILLGIRLGRGFGKGITLEGRAACVVDYRALAHPIASRAFS